MTLTRVDIPEEQQGLVRIAAARANLSLASYIAQAAIQAANRDISDFADHVVAKRVKRALHRPVR